MRELIDQLGGLAVVTYGIVAYFKPIIPDSRKHRIPLISVVIAISLSIAYSPEEEILTSVGKGVGIGLANSKAHDLMKSMTEKSQKKTDDRLNV